MLGVHVIPHNQTLFDEETFTLHRAALDPKFPDPCNSRSCRRELRPLVGTKDEVEEAQDAEGEEEEITNI
ncbi:hypothetical protein NDU88_004995 [Pleurodeles waltl]|uniref:Uncharacterized protein n=1 Tax=Pleurodeles waltl TaxID=8319 RepID=A0AAV7MBM1_PLEWA|nr:hypothetical protein NDU88_004995 [Pleurodeles waltl]